VVSVNLNNKSWKHVFWLSGAIIILFALPFISLKIINVPIDLYYFIFLICGALFLWIYKKRTSLNLRPALRSGWALGIISAIFIGTGLLSYTLSIKMNLLQAEFNLNLILILWRGVVFGIIGTALISAFPFITVWRAFAGANPGSIRKIGVSAIAILAISVTSLSYSVGISGFNKNLIIHNAKMNLLTGIPTLLSGNPLASPIAGAFLQSGESLFIENQSDTNTAIKLAARKTGGTN
jgi:hypothetical protein